MSNEFTLTWLGQGGYALRAGGKTLYVDPYLSDMVQRVDGPKRLVPAPVAPADARPDFFLATHAHMDHLDIDLIAAMDRSGVAFICPESCAAPLLALGIPEEQITVVGRGDEFDMGCCTLRAVYADHTPDSVGYVITAQGVALYITGDTLYGEAVGADAACDVIYCCVNGRWGNMDAAQALLVALRSGAGLAIPNHYGMFAENTADPAVFCSMAREAGLKTYTMAHGETINLEEVCP